MAGAWAMTDATEAQPPAQRARFLPLGAAFGALVALTLCELLVARMAAGRAARITALAGLLMAKVGLVLSFFMHARASRRAAAFALIAIGFAAAAGVVLMLETVWRVNVR